MPFIIVVIILASFLCGPSAFAGGKIEGRTDQSPLYEKTKHRYYRPTPLPQFKLEWPRFDLGDTDSIRGEEGEGRQSQRSREEGPSSGDYHLPTSKEMKHMSREEVMDGLKLAHKINEEKKRDLDEEIQRLEQG